MTWHLRIILAFIVATTLTAGTHAADDLPKVLIIGDSISLGYTPIVKAMMKGEADVVHNQGNAQHTGTGLQRLKAWLGDTKWDVIHFNWGLWDLCYRNPKAKTQGRRDKVNGKITYTLEQYEVNLTKLVRQLKQTDAVLIWGSISPVPEGELGRRIGDDLRYNAVAKKIMDANNITINDLHATILPRMSELQVKPGDVHFKREGSQILADAVVQHIRTALKK